MTADRAALVDKVVQMFKNGPDWAYSTRDIATAAIDLIRAEVLEEAAGVADEHEDDMPGTGAAIAAAIRALKEKA